MIPSSMATSAWRTASRPERQRCRSTTSSASAPPIAGQAALAFKTPAEDPMPVWLQSAAILAGSPSPAAAELFLRWLLEPDQQNAITQGGAGSPRLDIAPPPAWRRWRHISPITLAERTT
jgi:ABC-type Fe3+ transport system substrate-binding protein